ncbi:hypothetical protein EYF80_065949 [Liparis tanakae]|uniref:Uncharacterized protein n=1 Tax=Liparis tanakae TaxID=230148 RepID=A0A4Z2E564_9TELE|nr:hypothetical protein EYF80_065949 [Liparis tanakae]
MRSDPDAAPWTIPEDLRGFLHLRITRIPFFKITYRDANSVRRARGRRSAWMSKLLRTLTSKKCKITAIRLTT